MKKSLYFNTATGKFETLFPLDSYSDYEKEYFHIVPSDLILVDVAEILAVWKQKPWTSKEYSRFGKLCVMWEITYGQYLKIHNPKTSHEWAILELDGDDEITVEVDY